MNGLIEFCKAREACQQLSRFVAEERAESQNATRALTDMLKDSMVRHNVECIEFSRDGERVYVRMTTPPPRHTPLKTEKDIVDLACGVGEAIVSVECSSVVPSRVTEYIASQLKRRPKTQSAGAKVSIVSKPGRSISVQLASAPPEVRTLTQQFVQSIRTNKQISERLRPLQSAQKQNEQRALETFSEPVCVRMRKDGKEVDMRIVKCARKETKVSPTFGIRTILKMCQDCAEDVCRNNVDHTNAVAFENAFCNELVLRMNAHAQCPKPPKDYLKVYKLKVASQNMQQ